ncbi:796_t:CDS:2, partial [Entrophospora sp. SA101]
LSISSSNIVIIEAAITGNTDSQPEDDIALLLEDPAFTTRVQYVKGSTTSRQSLEKVRLDIASVVFILSKKFSKNDDEDDAAQILRAL